ncbi:helix-turn-helix transcriptional regulator [Lactococcus garvieae subsp. garvieae]|uniref:helix-turn-helix domain-containing protein n=1 Tax=Lactococcus garvieae TaxID=1363 RepID=UPI0009B8FA57|nr:helix-turn-helix transcriptional regulator [Lactococcus garvieae]KAA8710684.1 helix-turn-helix transcriptional regulator [Lactococcus garvieae subsp. garvieae]MDG6192271.1 helix-turn-helix transcriptional regulator [Lactococcus garvieae]QPR49398.1 helix-turn-helix transcriptional regulator [Lactococcus garvieae]
MEKFAYRLKVLRLSKNYTQSEVAEAVGVKQNSYNSWENGKREPKLDTVVLLAKIFDTNVDYLLGETDDKRNLKKLVELFNETNKRMDTMLEDVKGSGFLASNLRNLRESRGETREEIETFLPNRGDYFKWELGLAEPNLEELVILSNYYQVSIHSLYEYVLYKGGVYHKVNRISDAFSVKVDQKISDFIESMLDLTYEFGYKYADIEVSKKDFLSCMDYTIEELDSMKENLESQLAPIKENMIATYQREEKTLRENIERLRKQLEKEPHSFFLQEQLTNGEKALEDRENREKRLSDLENEDL